MTNQVNGVIAFYGLTDWWLSVFTESERQYIVGKYTRGETKWERENYLTEGDISINQEVTTF